MLNTKTDYERYLNNKYPEVKIPFLTPNRGEQSIEYLTNKYGTWVRNNHKTKFDSWYIQWKEKQCQQPAN